jgi:V/A-type H+-transporting ATPase subunit D
MERLPTTRSSLLQLEARRRVAGRGRDLLHDKREALARAFFELARGILGGRERLEQCLRDASRAIVIARSLDGDEVLESLALAASREIELAITSRRVWGVPTFEVTAPRLARSPESRGASPVGWSHAAIDAARLHERALEILLENSTNEILLRRLGDEIRNTSRRINALEQVIIPALDREAARIGLALSESERTDLVRLKHVRARMVTRR